MSILEQLQQVNNAIAAIEIGGQEYQIGSRRLKRADLSLLYQRQKELQGQLEAEKSDGFGLVNTSVAIFDRR
ncbi:peptidylprolyl isomerase [Lysinibacillus sp. AR18-8]|uniref:peptidylprolyl isomerase n=1 Tax=Lysinibacillus TaxID=400634 RepID=UPI000825B7A5|nr:MULTISPECIES: peptidylprolyl isomerase [unclassified Lysinibacillus]OCX63601.1 peptidylprolyl isomerase [Lysinibacillus sp. AR18-8]